MSMVINTNVASLASQRHLASSRADMEQAMERLSSGKRINSAMDDAAGLSISHSLNAKIAGLNQATRNANDGIAMINLAEGAMEEISNMLTRMKELSIQAASGTYDTDNQTHLDAEYEALGTEIDRIIAATDFNGVDVMTTVDVDIAVEDDGDTITVSFTAPSDATAATLGTDASAGSDLVDAAILEVDTQRAALGAVANRLEHTAMNLMSRVEHQSAARSRIEDADYAVESANLAKAQVLQQAGTAMLSQANASTQNVLSLLK